MFQTAELGSKTPKSEYKQRVPPLREALLHSQARVRRAKIPVIVLFGGVDGAGKGDVVNALNAWMDPRWVATTAFDDPSQEELERPEYWRFWRALPRRGRIGLLLSAWYSRPLLSRTSGGSAAELEAALDRIAAFEQQLADDGAVILKFWLHLGKQGQARRFKRLERDPLQAWRVSERDWENWRNYDEFAKAGERIITRTSTGAAPWHIVEGVCPRYASLRVGGLLQTALESALAREDALAEGALAAQRPSEPAAPIQPETGPEPRTTVLSTLDLNRRLAKVEYRRRLATAQGRLHLLQRRARERGISTVVAFEGWDAAGKGGTIRRINTALDSRNVQVHATAAPSDEERAQHYLWRFWRHLGRAGRVTIFDRSWYGRVLVERVEGLASDAEWQRAYAEINQFEDQLVEGGRVLLKFWMHLSPEEQLRRFREREQTPHKRWKLTDEDWRNRERWADYEIAVHDMVERTSTSAAPWVLVEANDKPWARVKVLEALGDALAQKVGPLDPPLGNGEPAPRAKARPKAKTRSKKRKAKA